MSETTLGFNRDIPIRADADVFVAGGGPAGIAAALTAARQGRTVWLAEGQNCFGGMATTALVPAFYRLYSDGLHVQAGGVGEEIYRTLFARGGFGPDVALDGPEHFLPTRTETLKRLYDDLIASEPRIRFVFGTQLIAVETDAGDVTHAVCSAKSGLFAVTARVFVDATGDGDLAAMAGAPFEKGDADGDLQPGTLCSIWAGIDWAAVAAADVSQQDGRLLARAHEDGVLSVLDLHLPGMVRRSPTTGGGNIGHTFGVDSTDESSVTRALLEGRRLMTEYERYYKEYLRGFENMELMTTGSALGVRESRRVLGDYVLDFEDYEKRAEFADEIGRYSYPIDLHMTRPDKARFEQFQHEYRDLRYADGESYGIPYRCLTPRGLHNVLVAGRCISCDRAIQGSVRVMSGCFITGQAAGMAAAMAAEAGCGVRNIDVGALQSRLKAIGAYLPNATPGGADSTRKERDCVTEDVTG